MTKDKKIKILIVDDEKAIARAMQLKLENVGFEAIIAQNGLEAIAALEKEKFGAMLLDLVMPKMDGFAVLKELADHKNKTPIIITSNLSQQEDIRRAKDLGAVDYFIKSDTPISEIVNYVNKAINRGDENK